jgi:hypothetical protein
VNLDTVTANVLVGFSGSIGDGAGNVYLGVNAGNSYSNSRGSSNNTFVGINAGANASNTVNSVFLGYGTGYGMTNAYNSVLIGANTTGGSSNNIFVGPNISQAGTVSNLLYIGSGRTNPPAITADLGSVYGHVGIGTMPDTLEPYGIGLEMVGYAYIGKGSTGGLSINKAPGAHSLDVNGDMYMSDGHFIFSASTDSNTANSTLLFDTATSGKTAIVNATGGFTTAKTVTASNVVSSNISNSGTVTTSSIVANVGISTLKVRANNGFNSSAGSWTSMGNGTTFNITPTVLNSTFTMIVQAGSVYGTIQGLYTSTAFFQTVAPVVSGSGFAIISNAGYITISNTSMGATTFAYGFTHFTTV